MNMNDDRLHVITQSFFIIWDEASMSNDIVLFEDAIAGVMCRAYHLCRNKFS